MHSQFLLLCAQCDQQRDGVKIKLALVTTQGAGEYCAAHLTAAALMCSYSLPWFIGLTGMKPDICLSRQQTNGVYGLCKQVWLLT